MQNHYDRLEVFIRKACAMMDSCEPVILLRKMEEFTTQPQLKAKKERLEIQVKDLTKNQATKSEGILHLHAKHDQV